MTSTLGPAPVASPVRPRPRARATVPLARPRGNADRTADAAGTPAADDVRADDVRAGHDRAGHVRAEDAGHNVDDVATPLDALLVDAVLSPLRRFSPRMSGLRLAARLVTHPTATGRLAAVTARDLGKVVTGSSAVSPEPKDRRFTEVAWTDNAVLRRVLQGYLVLGATARDVARDPELSWRDRERLTFLAENLVDALSPSNNPLLNPAALKAALDTGGVSLARGARNLARDMRAKPRVPSMVDTTAFDVGRNVGITPGAVVLRTEVFELIQYTPQTATVRTAPLLMVPPTINKYYVADLAPGRSMVEHFVASGQQVFIMSWRNPGREQADWGFDTYAQAVLDALEAVEQICDTDKTMLFSLCAGGIITTLALGHLLAAGQEHRLAGFALGVTVLDQSHAGLMAAVTGPQVVAAAVAESRASGFLDGRALAEVFAWLRPNDLIWNYWVNNYLLGRQPPAFDILYWNADTTRMAARLHADFLHLSLHSSLTRPGAVTVLGSPVDLSRVTVDSYVVAGITDHICPWASCYRSVHMLGGRTRFVLSTSGHIAALVNPPGNPKASYRVSEDLPDDPEAFLAAVTPTQGSWWSDFVAWFSARSGPDKPAPDHLGSDTHLPLAAAPGSYVFTT